MNAINWFEIPVTDISRAKAFYGAILQAELSEMDMGPYKMAFFPSDMQAVGGALSQGPECVPSMTGTLVYLNGGDDLSLILGRVEAAGGKVLMEKAGIGENAEHGYMGLFADTEGNKVGLHSMK